MATKKPYERRTDAEKVFDNWTKTLGLFERGEYSVAIVRAAISMELAANLVVRAELLTNRSLPADFVGHLLKRANGLTGKFENLIYPILKGSPRYQSLKALSTDWRWVNKERNSVVHSGQFKNKKTAEKALSLARKAVIRMVAAYDPSFRLGKTKSKHLMLRSAAQSPTAAAKVH